MLRQYRSIQSYLSNFSHVSVRKTAFSHSRNLGIFARSGTFSGSGSGNSLSGQMRSIATHYEPHQCENNYYSTQLEYMQREGSQIQSSTVSSTHPHTTHSHQYFSLMLPPPNITGRLHIGHALTLSIQDTLTRYHKMMGASPSVFIPGMDHAGISTQVVVEKKIARLKGMTRIEMGRERFLEEMHTWEREYKEHIRRQISELGAVCDWNREVFTLDEPREHAVREAFVRLFEEGYIYRERRLVNWCVELGTAISDIEVDSVALKGRTKIYVPSVRREVEFGVMHHFKYPVENDNGFIQVSTTRIETMCGDTAVAVHSEDERYKHLHGKFCIHPITGRRMPIICDDQLVDPEFGTGAVKITPAHDFNDFECGRRHNLDMVPVFDRNGMTTQSEEWRTVCPEPVDRYEARERIIQHLTELGLYVGAENHEMQLPVCERSRDVLEPMLLPQWFVRCKEFAQTALELSETGVMNIHPERYRITWRRWLENIHDWCISRQLWWGHRIPAYQVVFDLNESGSGGLDTTPIWIAAHSEDEAREKLLKQHPSLSSRKFTLAQDEDVLDTWFSSGLYPIGGLGWPNTDSPDLKTLYPLSLLETGEDILFFWAARMVMLCTHLYQPEEGKVLPPFKDIYLHTMVRDAQGRKMSKSLGNVIDPVDMKMGKNLEALQADIEQNTNIGGGEVKKAMKSIERQFPQGIPECGTDAMRFTLIQYMHQGRSINLDVNKALSNRHFCNKVWQATRFILRHLENLYGTQGDLGETDMEGFFAQRDNGIVQCVYEIDGLHNQWIIAELAQCVEQVHSQMDKYLFGEAVNTVHDFFLHKFCDVYLEMSKRHVKEDDIEGVTALQIETLRTLRFVLNTFLRLAHPFLPFITDELWHELNPARDAKVTVLSTLVPRDLNALVSSAGAHSAVSEYLDVVQKIRSAKSILLEPSQFKSTPIVIEVHDGAPEDVQRVWSNRQEAIQIIEDLTNSPVQLGAPASVRGEARLMTSVHVSIRMPFSEEKVSDSVKKLERELASLTKAMEKLTQRMESEKYTRTPENIQEKDRETMATWRTNEEALKQELRKLQEIQGA